MSPAPPVPPWIAGARRSTDAFAGHPDDNPAWPAFLDSVERYKIPHEYFYDMIEGVASDLEPRTIETFDELYQYCYRVASVVGLTTIHIFGFTSPDALPLAEKCGIAFQLTNILRDVREDAGLGRVYLPAEDLVRFGVSADDLKEGRRTEQFGRLMEFETERARPLLPRIRAAAEAHPAEDAPFALGADCDLFAPARPRGGIEVRRADPPDLPFGHGEDLDRAARGVWLDLNRLVL